MRSAAAAVILLVLGGCASGYADLDRVARSPGWTIRTFVDGPAPSLAAYRAPDGARTMWVFVEGDGQAWLSRRRPSADPTPRRALALALAEKTGTDAVLYLARPCQYLKRLDATCDSRLWSIDRYGRDVLDQLQRALDVHVRILQPERIVLVGYSGGGVLATLLAAERDDVALLMTLAANLSLAAWTSHHGVTPLTGSIDPVTLAPQLAGIRQVHVAGKKDTVVPTAVVADYVGRLPPGHHAWIKLEPAFDHACCWEREWPRLRNEVMLLSGLSTDDASSK